MLFSVNVAGRFGVPCFLMVSFFIYWHQLYDKGRIVGGVAGAADEAVDSGVRVLVAVLFCVLHKVLEGRGLNVDPGPLGHDHLNWKDPGVWRRCFCWGRRTSICITCRW